MRIYDETSGQYHTLSEEVYEVIAGGGWGQGMFPKGSKVRLISGVNRSLIPGYHFSPGYVTVCRVESVTADHFGMQIVYLKLLNGMEPFELPTGLLDSLKGSTGS